LLIGRSLGQPIPEGQHSQDHAGQSDNDKQGIANSEKLLGGSGLVGVAENTAGMVHSFDGVVDAEKDQADSVEAHVVGRNNVGQVQAGILDLNRHILFLHLLEVQLGEHVQPVGNLRNEKEFEAEGHGIVWISLP